MGGFSKMGVATMEYYPMDYSIDYGADEIETATATGNAVWLWVVIGVCALAGIALGIITGRRSARK